LRVNHFDVIVIGAGAAGLICAIEAGKRGRRVLVLECNDRIGRKILISGGGRCNFTNIHTRPENFISANPHFAKSALARYTPAHFIALVEKHRIPSHEKALGQLFCDGPASAITKMLEDECRAAGVRIVLRHRVTEVSRADEFILDEYAASTLVIASGGLSIPKIGATDIGYRIARQFAHRVVPPKPALVPLVAPGFTELAGVSTEVVASVATHHFREKMLFTHRGLSGPAILQASSYLPGPLVIDLLPDIATLEAPLAYYLPKRLARMLSATPLEDLHSWKPLITGNEGFEKAEVTAGGVDTNDLSSKTMESRKVPGLFFIGEVADVTGHLGGFNFQWAWASGYAAGQSV
jgi:predicted Rossmann fold flavoprotein